MTYQYDRQASNVNPFNVPELHICDKVSAAECIGIKKIRRDVNPNIARAPVELTAPQIHPMFPIATFGMNETPPTTAGTVEGGRPSLNSLPRRALMVHPDE